MAACNKATLISSAVSNQFTGAAPEVVNALILQLLCEISGMACNKATLLSDAITNGFTGVEPNVWNALVLQLLCEIQVGGGVGGSQEVYEGNGDPNGVVTPADPTKPAIYNQLDGPQPQWRWIVAAQAWT